MTRTRAERIVADVGFAEGPVCLPGIYQSVTNRIVAAIEAGLAELSRCSGFGSDSISVLKKVFLKIWAKWALCPGVWLAISTVARRLEALLKIERDPDLGIKTIDAERHGGKWVVRAGGGKGAPCPGCGKLSKSRKSSYRRPLQDLPIQEALSGLSST